MHALVNAYNLLYLRLDDNQYYEYLYEGVICRPTNVTYVSTILAYILTLMLTYRPLNLR